MALVGVQQRIHPAFLLPVVQFGPSCSKLYGGEPGFSDAIFPMLSSQKALDWTDI